MLNVFLQKKLIPDVLSTIFVPFLTIFVMVPITFVVLAPIGNLGGELIGNGLIAFGNVGGFLSIAVVAALWEFLVMSGNAPSFDCFWDHCYDAKWL